MVYLENWLALGACIYSRKTADAALAALGLRKEIKRKPVYMDIETNTLITLYNDGLSIRQSLANTAYRIHLLEIAYLVLV